MRNKDAARPGDRLQSAGDVHSVPENIVRFHNDIAQTDAYTENGVSVARLACVPDANDMLELHCEPYRQRGTHDLGHETVAGIFEYSRAIRCGCRLDNLQLESHAASVRASLVLRHLPRIADHVGD